MKTSRVVNLKEIRFFDFAKKNKIIILLCILFAIGVGLGTFSLNKSNIVNAMSENYLNSYIQKRTDTSFLSVMFSSAISSFLIMLISFVFGASLMGIVTVPLLICWCGFEYGCVSALLYSQYALKGVAFNAIILIPSSVVFLISLLFASRESIAFSLVISKLTLPKSRPTNIYMDFKNYCGRYIFLSFLIIVSALINSILTSSFMKFFDF
mgnify:CR=1 FL=1